MEFLYAAFGILILLGAFVGIPIFRSWANSKASNVGEAAGQKFAAAQLPKALTEFGQTPVFNVPGPRAREIVSTAIDRSARTSPPERTDPSTSHPHLDRLP